MIAVCQIRDLPHYRKDAFLKGLRTAGYSVSGSGKPSSPLDLLIIWNRYGGLEKTADTWERLGGTVLVCENGYIGQDKHGHQLYAISAAGHNGSGWWVHTGYDRFSTLGIDVKPWNKENKDGHILVCGQRGIGSRTMASPTSWHDKAALQLKVFSSNKIKIRPHPGNQPAKTTLLNDLEGAYGCVIWSSSSGVKALVNGYPVFYDAPHWICSLAAMKVSDINKPNYDDKLRELALVNMADAQWTVDEIASGEPFVRFAEHITSGKKRI